MDILPNRILRTSLHGLRDRRIPLRGTVRSEVRSAYRRLDGISRTRLKRNTFGQVQLGGIRRLYQFLLSVCKLLYDSQLVDEETGHVRFLDFRRDEARMWRLFEEFLTGFYRREQADHRVNRGGRRIPWAQIGGATPADRMRIPVMEADVILESPSRRIIVDTKYYTHPLSGRGQGGVGKLHSPNLYQLLAYLRNREATRPQGPKHEGILLYPQVNEPLRTDIRLEGFRIQARTVDLNQDWRDIHSEMLATIDA